MWEIAQGVGAMAGLLAFVLLVWDRVSAENPSAYIISVSNQPGWTRFQYLRVRNNSDRTLLVTAVNDGLPGHFNFAVDHDLGSIVGGTMRGRTVVAIDGKGEHDFVLLKPFDYKDLDPRSFVAAQLKWRFAHGLYKQDRRMSVSIVKQDFEAIEAGVVAPFGRG